MLSVVNKDGGAHVDASLTPEYELLIAEGSLGTLVHRTEDGEYTTPISDAHFIASKRVSNGPPAVDSVGCGIPFTQSRAALEITTP